MPQQRYEQVAEDLRRRIVNGEFPPGSRLPSWSDISQEYQVSRSTVAKVMLLLRTAGLVTTLGGVGVFVADQARYVRPRGDHTIGDHHRW